MQQSLHSPSRDSEESFFLPSCLHYTVRFVVNLQSTQAHFVSGTLLGKANHRNISAEARRGLTSSLPRAGLKIWSDPNEQQLDVEYSLLEHTEVNFNFIADSFRVGQSEARKTKAPNPCSLDPKILWFT